MDQITFVNINNRYSLDVATSHSANILGFFLYSDVGNYPLDWLNWVNGTQSFTSSNISSLCKDDQNVYIYDLYAEPNDKTCFETTKEKFIKMLHDWDQLIKQQPNHINITIHDNGDIILESKND